MKSLLYIVGTLAALHAPAVAGKKKPSAKPNAVTAPARVEVALPAQVAAQPTTPTPADAPAQLDIPALPADTSSPFEPMSVATPIMKAASKHTNTRPAVMKTGTDYMLGRRQAAKPEREYEAIIPKSLNQAQVATVVQSHMADIQNCWDLVPKAQRASACTAMLQLSISDAGAVTAISLGGDVAAAAHECITSAVSRWTFPVAETRTEIEYGISLRSL